MPPYLLTILQLPGRLPLPLMWHHITRAPETVPFETQSCQGPGLRWLRRGCAQGKAAAWCAAQSWILVKGMAPHGVPVLPGQGRSI